MDEIAFDWDPAKDEANALKHGIDFATASKIFFGPVLEFPSNQPGEARWVAIGRVFGRETTVVYTMRDGVHRIISARRASEYERAAYRQIYPE